MTQVNEISTAEQAEINTFNASVDHCIGHMFGLNKTLLTDGVPPAAVALSNALSAADIAAAIALENEGGLAQIEVMLADLMTDMKDRAEASFARFSATKTAIGAEKEETVNA